MNTPTAPAPKRIFLSWVHLDRKLKDALPRFAGPGADKGSLPVLLRPLPGFGPGWNLHGVERQVVFTLAGKSFAELTGARRTVFANELAAAIRWRLLGPNGYQTLNGSQALNGGRAL